ncbi:hypothetical protein [Rhodococcus sp. BH5]|uniref:hypothetical protein n=1 Tax=Rhodococcus sp. BH5 TaxID=2871702 RepID=UPI0022CD7C78|nr:hypothetical protein [Rhodococcus sp. BH5]MCZ9634694.1 hypothetical protein [Rhodococcus sp. BH5]
MSALDQEQLERIRATFPDHPGIRTLLSHIQTQQDRIDTLDERNANLSKAYRVTCNLYEQQSIPLNNIRVLARKHPLHEGQPLPEEHAKFITGVHYWASETPGPQ